MAPTITIAQLRKGLERLPEWANDLPIILNSSPPSGLEAKKFYFIHNVEAKDGYVLLCDELPPEAC